MLIHTRTPLVTALKINMTVLLMLYCLQTIHSQILSQCWAFFVVCSLYDLNSKTSASFSMNYLCVTWYPRPTNASSQV